MAQAKTRIEWLDIFKGIAIFLVVLGHLNTGDLIHNFIYGFHLPAFLFVSGIFYKQRESVKEFFYKDIKKILLMFVFFAVLWLGFEYVYKLAINYTQGGIELFPLGEYLWRSVVALIYGNCNITNVSFGANWYLAMLICVKLIYAAVDKVAKKQKNILLWIIFGVLFVVGLTLLNGVNKLPFYLSSAMVGLFFFHSGRECAQLTAKIVDVSFVKSALLSVCSFAVAGVVSYFFGESNLGANTYENAVAFIVTAFSGTVGISFLSVCISKIPKIKDIISYYGKNSLSVMGWHSQIRIVVSFGLSLLNIDNAFLKVIIIIVATLVLCIPLNKITNCLLKGVDSIRLNTVK